MQQHQEPATLAAHWSRRAPQYADRLWTATDFTHLPEDGNRYELIAGKVLQMPPPRKLHGKIQGFIITLLNMYLWQAGIAGSARTETGYLLSVPGEPDTVLGPDVSYVAAEREGIPEEAETYERVAPDWVVEIASPSQGRKELLEKVRIYLAAEVRLVWLVWPAPQFIEVWQGGAAAAAKARDGEIIRSAVFTATDTITGADVLPGFTCSIEALFEGMGGAQVTAQE